MIYIVLTVSLNAIAFFKGSYVLDREPESLGVTVRWVPSQVSAVVFSPSPAPMATLKIAVPKLWIPPFSLGVKEVFFEGRRTSYKILEDTFWYQVIEVHLLGLERGGKGDLLIKNL